MRIKPLDVLIIQDKNFLFTALSYIAILAIFINLNTVGYPLISTIASTVFFLINSTFLGYTFFEKEERFLRLILGSLLFTMFLGFTGWLIMIPFYLNVSNSVIALFILATFSALTKLKRKNIGTSSPPQRSRREETTMRIKGVRLLYSFFIVVLFYLLFISRSGEVYTVWQFLHPIFFPLFLTATTLLLVVIFSSERVEYKLLFIIMHSILIHSLFIIIFPAGDIGTQTLTLGRIRLVYENVSINGWPVSLPHTANILSRIYYWFRGINFETALTVVIARVLNVDILPVHLWLVPVLWGAFIPVAAFLVSRTLWRNSNVWLISGLLVSMFPTTIYYGAISVANSLGFVFFFFLIFFVLRYLSDGSKYNRLMVFIFCFFSVLAHNLTGVIAFSFVLLAVALKRYEKEKSLKVAGVFWFSSFLFSAGLLPMALVYLKLFFPFHTFFSLKKLNGMSTVDAALLFLFGRYANFNVVSAFFHIIGPLLGFIGIVFFLIRDTRRGSKFSKIYYLFFFTGFLIYLVDYRVLELFMTGAPINADRLWIFRDFMAVAFAALILHNMAAYLPEKLTQAFNNILQRMLKLSPRTCSLPSILCIRKHVLPRICIKLTFTITSILILVTLSGLLTASLYLGYPHSSPLQVTSYELEAARYIETSTSQKYIVIADQWFIFAGQLLVGIKNPNAFYFDHRDPRGVALFMKAKNNPEPTVMVEAMKHNNATIAYFVIEKPRLGAEEYNRITQQAQQNNLQTYRIFYYKGEEKLRIFYYKSNSYA